MKEMSSRSSQKSMHFGLPLLLLLEACSLEVLHLLYKLLPHLNFLADGPASDFSGDQGAVPCMEGHERHVRAFPVTHMASCQAMAPVPYGCAVPWSTFLHAVPEEQREVHPRRRGEAEGLRGVEAVRHLGARRRSSQQGPAAKITARFRR